MKKVLFTATVDSHIMNFHIPYLKYFKENGYEVHVASNGTTDIPSTDFKYNVPFQRSPYKLENIKAYRQLKKIINSNKYDTIHCHTPMGAAITRLAAKKSRYNGTKVIYTAHGFHFFKGAALKNWLLFYPIEKWLSRYTDELITINKEDFEIAINSFNAANVHLINGVGVNLEKFRKQNLEKRNQQRKEYGYPLEDYILIYVGELSYRKHQDLLIKAVNYLKEEIPNLRLLIVGDGEKIEKYKLMADKLGVNGNVDFLGYRNDIEKLMMLSDVAVSSSRQEGLPLNIMEAMATGLPLIVTNCRGNRDLVYDKENGYVIDINDANGFSRAIHNLYAFKDICGKFSNKNIDLIDAYSLETISTQMSRIYKIK
ncbi:putative glycosyltransferase EpsD [Paenibacillus albidus]|uniref:Glycosyltransferase EpsD n=1 Tax=Paenibacillus albidus TaxID=2041023 RepID=A0A917BWZ9_9BACL|nr:glycosyltransferase family 4 protein [Paenibacillus albidus]GGF58935.1 putative glycosyltransferase EpsD [Paenibacillus albidus]